MKIIAKPIEVISFTDKEGNINPIKFRIEENEKYKVIIIKKVIDKKKEKVAGNPMYVYICQGEINNVLKVFEIKYEILTSKWILFKI